jgi:hypothetical protein
VCTHTHHKDINSYTGYPGRHLVYQLILMKWFKNVLIIMIDKSDVNLIKALVEILTITSCRVKIIYQKLYVDSSEIKTQPFYKIVGVIRNCLV